MQNVRNAGFTAVQIYTFWRDFEPGARGRFEWDKLDAKVRLIGPDSEEAWGIIRRSWPCRPSSRDSPP